MQSDVHCLSFFWNACSMLFCLVVSPAHPSSLVFLTIFFSFCSLDQRFLKNFLFYSYLKFLLLSYLCGYFASRYQVVPMEVRRWYLILWHWRYNRYVPSDGCWELSLGSLEEQPVFITTKPYRQLKWQFGTIFCVYENYEHAWYLKHVQKRMSDPQELKLQICELPCGFWEMKPGLL